MRIVVPKETLAGETRVPVIPPHLKRLIEKGAQFVVESGLGSTIGARDEDYREAGAEVLEDRQELLRSADIVLRLRKPPLDEVLFLKPKSIHISFLDPFNESQLVDELTRRDVTAISMEMIPRSTRAQKFDALSSQANLAGYVAVILAAEALDKVLPMMTTPAGTLSPSRVFVVGAGVAGLQAIATARRLGARVEAFDTRPVVEEQVRSLGARFVKIELGETGQTEQGYAKALTDEQLALQREGMARVCAQSDIVITTAQLFGKPAPRIITQDMISRMNPGSVIVDLAVESGGNVEGSKRGEVIEFKGVRIIGYENLPGHVPVHASQMYSSNITSLVDQFWDQEVGFQVNLEDEILMGCVITHSGAVCNEMVLNLTRSTQQR